MFIEGQIQGDNTTRIDIGSQTLIIKYASPPQENPF